MSLHARGQGVRCTTGGEKISELVLKLADERQINIGAGAEVKDVPNDLDLVARLRPLAQAVEALSHRLKDTIMEAQSESCGES